MNISSWPSGKIVDIQCWWRVGDEIMVAENSHISGIIEGGDEGISGIVPMTYVIYGIIAAVVVTLVSRLAYGWMNASPSTSDGASVGAGGTLSRKEKSEQRKARKSALRESKTSVKKSTSSSEKLEVPCPSCEQKLSVPTTFSGTVRCPSCRHEFDVEAESEPEVPAPVTSTDEDEHSYESDGERSTSEGATAIPSAAGRDEEETDGSDEPGQLVVASKSDILPCPDCEAKLRVPLEKRPVRARCPACKTEFMAHAI
jgi:Zn finger protein HypA/HybF involved in hydrogenase expression